jgi:hypothetical protein
MPRPLGSPKIGGRAKGTPNKSTTEFRETVSALLSKNAANVEIWLRQVAEGQPDQNIKPAPEKALDLLAKLAEYAAPKLNRTEHVGDGGGPMKTVIEWQTSVE